MFAPLMKEVARARAGRRALQRCKRLEIDERGHCLARAICVNPLTKISFTVKHRVVKHRVCMLLNWGCTHGKLRQEAIGSVR